MANGKTCGSCGGTVEAKPVDTSQIASGSLQPVTNACSCAQPTTCTPSCPQPSPCEEDHCKETVINNFSATVKTTTSFNFPAMGADVTFKLANVTSLIPGQILWNQGVGRLHVQSYDPVTREVTATNLGDSCTTTGVAVGELVQSCTEFGVSIPECNVGGGGTTAGPFLGADFVAPGDPNCALMKVTDVTGLALNDIISVAGFQYRINAILDTETIEVCDEGEGAPKGQVIEWDPNCDNTPDIPIIVLSGENPCDQTPENSGNIVICNGSDQLTTLGGSITGQTPIWDNDLEKFVLVNTNVEDECTALTACLIVNIGDDGPYIAIVEDTSLFQVDGNIVIDGDVFLIDQIIDPTTLELTPAVTPPAIKEYGIGEKVCKRDCCEELKDPINCFPAGVASTITAIPFNYLFTDTGIQAGMADRYYVNPLDTADRQELISYTNDSRCPQTCFLHLNVLHSVKMSLAATKAVSEVQLTSIKDADPEDLTSILPRVLNHFEGQDEGFGNNGPANSFQETAGWDALSVHTGYTVRHQTLQPGEAVTFYARHYISFNPTGGGNNPPGGSNNYYLFLHGHFKAFRQP